MMKRAAIFISLLFILILAAATGCVPSPSDQQLTRIESQLQALTATLATTQQELTATKKSLADAQDETRLLQQQLQEAQQAQTASYIKYQEPIVQTITIVSDAYTPYYYTRDRYPCIPNPPMPHPMPPHPMPHPPMPPPMPPPPPHPVPPHPFPLHSISPQDLSSLGQLIKTQVIDRYYNSDLTTSHEAKKWLNSIPLKDLLSYNAQDNLQR